MYTVAKTSGKPAGRLRWRGSAGSKISANHPRAVYLPTWRRSIYAEERLVSCTHDCAYVYLRMKLNTSKSSRGGRLAGSDDGRGDQGGNGRWDVHLTTVGARGTERIYPSLLRIDVWPHAWSGSVFGGRICASVDRISDNREERSMSSQTDPIKISS